MVGAGAGTRVVFKRTLDNAKGSLGIMAGMVRKGTAKAMARELASLKAVLEG